ncbi:hypothetical protein GXW82_44445 [Streptacidiphilus sp. 4-A2]|nr:hypothetical protein [Streptacidiphilus sp. 4-A2]
MPTEPHTRCRQCPPARPGRRQHPRPGPRTPRRTPRLGAHRGHRHPPPRPLRPQRDAFLVIADPTEDTQ